MRLVDVLRDVTCGDKIRVVVEANENQWGPFRHEYSRSFLGGGHLVLWSFGSGDDSPLHGFEIDVETMRFDSVRPNMPRNILSDGFTFERAARGVRSVTMQIKENAMSPFAFQLDHQSRTLRSHNNEGPRR